MLTRLTDNFQSIMKKIITYMIWVLLIMGCQPQKKSSLSYMPLYMTTITTALCDEFEERFKGELKNIVLKEDEISNFCQILENLPLATNEYNMSNMDVRVKGEIHVKPDSIINICLSTTLVSVNGQLHFMNDEMRTFIMNTCKYPSDHNIPH